jgi:hypothetical protein
MEEAIPSSLPTERECQIEYFLPLSTFEQRLLADLDALLNQHHFLSFDAQTTPVAAVFSEWKWTDLVKGGLKDNIGGESFNTEYHGDRSKAYNGLMQFLGRMDREKRNLARTEGFQEANPDFLVRLEDRPISDVEVKPVETDLPYWETISRLYQTDVQYWKHKDIRRNPHGTFDIFRLIRRFTLMWQWPENKDVVYRVLVTSAAFEEFYDVKQGVLGSDSDSDLGSGPSHYPGQVGRVERLKITKRPPSDSVPKVHKLVHW